MTISDSSLFEQLAEGLGGAKTPKRIKYNCTSAFGGVNLEGRTILEIGAGAGLLSAYASQFAQHVVALEPEAAGSSGDYLSTIHRLKHSLQATNLEIVSNVLQDYKFHGQRFDLVVLHDSVNHLCEDACEHLHQSEEARRIYQDIFSHVAEMMVDGGRMLIFDCSPRNFFHLAHVKHPITPQIEWRKHQPPRVWLSLLEPLGFVREELSWTVAYPLRVFSPILANSVAAFFLFSHFRLIVHLDRQVRNSK